MRRPAVPRPGDVARWLFWVHLRELVEPDEPELLRALASIGARAQALGRPARRHLMKEEVRRTFPGAAWSERTLAKVCHAADDLQVQCMVEELVLGRLTPETVGRYMRFDGREHLDRARADGRGALLVFPHAGNVMLLIALVSLSGYPLTQIAARGFPPEDRQILADVRPSWFNVQAREAREADEDRLPARFHAIDDSPRQLYRDLADNRVVAIAFDGRGGAKFRPTRWLGRTALLSTGPWRLAASTGASLVPALCVRDRDRSHRLVLMPPIAPDAALAFDARCDSLQRKALDAIEAVLANHPDHYARWLVHCRLHAGMDDHPLFVDTAPDDRWRAHEATRW